MKPTGGRRISRTDVHGLKKVRAPAGAAPFMKLLLLQ